MAETDGSEPPEDVLALKEAACAGDRAALDALMVRYLPQLRAFVRLRAGPLVRVHESSSDLVQSVCREVIQNAERFRHPSESAFKQWLLHHGPAQDPAARSLRPGPEA